MNSFSQIIERLGGSTEAARKLGTSQQNAWDMSRRNNIPARYWPVITATFPDVSLHDLAQLAVNRNKGAA